MDLKKLEEIIRLIDFEIERPIVFFDLETTGVNVANDRIVQFGGIKLKVDKTIEKAEFKCNPRIPIEAGATAIHGITDEDVKNEHPFSNYSHRIQRWIAGCDIGGYNHLAFDVPILVQEMNRDNLHPNLSNIKFIDVMKVYHILKPRTLSACFTDYTGKTLENAHDAMEDIGATMEIYFKMLGKHKKEIGTTTEDYHNFVFGGREILDYAGVFHRNDEGVICYSKGKYKDTPCVDNISYIDWILSKDFTDDTKGWAYRIKQGKVK